MPTDSIHIKADTKSAMKELRRIEKSLDRSKINSIQRRNAKPMLQDMKQGAPSHDIAEMTKITTRQTSRKWHPAAPEIGIRIGVIKNDPAKFPTFSAPALASVLEHGTDMRYRRAAKSFGISIGTQPTGKVTPSPWIRPAYDRHEQAFIAKTIRSYERQVN